MIDYNLIVGVLDYILPALFVAIFCGVGAS